MSVFRWTLSALLADYLDGDEVGWQAELRWLWSHDRSRMLALLDDVLENGIREPILLGTDGRVWDGHHRIGVALALGFDTISAVRAVTE